MILDRLESAARYAALHEGFPAAFDFLRQTDLARLAPGRHELRGDRLFALVEHVTGRGRECAKLEVHRQYIDIQLALVAPDLIGWRGRAACACVEREFDTEKDCELLGDEPEAWITLAPGSFLILFPEDAHAPLAAEGPLHKVVVKVAVKW
jgi:YhcH/YjgK/YiaL family protein